MDIQDIATRLQNGYPVSDQERAFLIRNNINALAAFMIDNNPGAVNMSLRNMGYDLGFAPDKKALTKQLQMLIDRNDIKDFETVVKDFDVRPDGLSSGFLSQLYSQFNS